MQDGTVTHFRIKRVTKMQKVSLRLLQWLNQSLPVTPPTQLIDSWGQHQSVDVKTVRFMFEGNTVSPQATPEELGA